MKPRHDATAVTDDPCALRRGAAADDAAASARARECIPRVHHNPNRDDTLPLTRFRPASVSSQPRLTRRPDPTRRHSSSIPPSALANAAFMDISYH